MQYECKITVLETNVFPELQEKYLADSKSGPCPCFKAGDTFVLKRTPEEEEWLSKQDFHNGADQAYTGLSIDPVDAGLIEYGAPDACSIEDHKSGRKGC